MVVLKDVTGRQLEVGDIIIRPVFSCLFKHIVIKFTNVGIVVSRSLQYDNTFKGSYTIFKDRFNIDNHNSTLYIHKKDVSDFIIIGKAESIPDLPSKKKFDQLNKEKNDKKI